MIRREVVATLEEWRGGTPAAPEEVQIYPTNVCNLRCVFCITTTGFYKGMREVSKERWLSVAQELCDLGVKRVLISGGGEPLLSPATLPMMRLFKDAGIYGRMINNGTMWNEQKIRDAIEMGWDQITFSVDGPNAQVHDSLRGVPGAWEKTMNNIRRFSELKREEGSETPRLEMNVVMNRRNYRLATEFVEMAAELGIAHLNLEPVCDNNPNVADLNITQIEREELETTLIPAAYERAKEKGISNNFEGLMKVKHVENAGQMRGFLLEQLDEHKEDEPMRELACYEPWLWPKIEANGEVWPCSTTPLQETIFDKSFKEIWHGATFAEYRRKIIDRDLPESCRNCVVSHMHTNGEIRDYMRTGEASFY